MNHKSSARYLIGGAITFGIFILFTILVSVVDVRAVSSEAPPVGFSTFNARLLPPYNSGSASYDISELLGTAILLIPLFFGVFCLAQWIKRKNLRAIDRDLFVLFGAYALMAAFYALFEVWVVNYRPVAIDGVFEASYPSSHTLLAIVILGTAILQIRRRITVGWLRITLELFSWLVLTSTILTRYLSGMHWFTDIVGSLFLGISILLLYHGISLLLVKSNETTNETE